MKINIKWIIFLAVLFESTACGTKSNNKPVRKKHGNYFIEAHYIDNERIDGVARYFDNDGVLISQAEFKLGIKYGPACNFYPSGKKSDSMYFVNGLLHGKAFAFDSIGQTRKMVTNYYGVAMGDNVEYINLRPVKYSFNDFYSNTILSCIYDSLGRCRHIKYDLSPISTVVYNGDDSLLSVKCYLPRPPLVDVSFKLGLINPEKEIILQNEIFGVNRIFLDTVLQKPTGGTKYFVSATLRTIDSSINKVLVYELQW